MSESARLEINKYIYVGVGVMPDQLKFASYAPAFLINPRYMHEWYGRCSVCLLVCYHTSYRHKH